MIIEGIDYSKCINCGKCEKVCPSKLYTHTKETNNKIRFVFSNPYRLCVRCGHCIAICPPEAINFSDADQPFVFEGTKKLDEIIPYNTLLTALRMRRSIRVYKEEKVPTDQIEKVLEAMRYAPSASNLQGWRYIVITNEDQIKLLSMETAKFFQTARKLFPLRYLVAPFVGGETRKRVLDKRSKKHLDTTLERIRQGEDVIFFNAPCVIILYSKSNVGILAANDAGIALTHGMVAAQSLGLGTCWIGFAQRKLRHSKKLQKRLGIPKGFAVQGIITLGIPALQYERGPPRRSLRINWIE